MTTIILNQVHEKQIILMGRFVSMQFEYKDFFFLFCFFGRIEYIEINFIQMHLLVCIELHFIYRLLVAKEREKKKNFFFPGSTLGGALEVGLSKGWGWVGRSQRLPYPYICGPCSAGPKSSVGMAMGWV